MYPSLSRSTRAKRFNITWKANGSTGMEWWRGEVKGPTTDETEAASEGENELRVEDVRL